VWGNVVDGTMLGKSQVGILRVFCDSTRIPDWSDQQIKDSTINFLKQMFPDQQNLVQNYKDIIIYDWNKAKPTIPGVTYAFPRGVLSKYGKAFTAPHGCIHWGGSERAYWGVNWMEGAVERGNDTAQEILNKERPAARPLARGIRPMATTTRVQPTAAASSAAEPSLVDLARELQPNPDQPMSLDELIQHHSATEGKAAGRITPKQCLAALKQLQELKARRRSARPRTITQHYAPGDSQTGHKRPLSSTQGDGKKAKDKIADKKQKPDAKEE